MSPNAIVLAVNDDLPIRTHAKVHSGKVRSVYWLTPDDSLRLIREQGYILPSDAPLAVMVISDRISAFDCIWHGEGGLMGVPGKGAALNAIATHWFSRFREQGLAASHIVDIPHPLVWIVQQARPVMIEAIARQYITGTMWRAYKNATSEQKREFCGITLPKGLSANQRLPELLITPSTKGVLTGLSGVPEVDDTNISRADIERHYQAFGFTCVADIDRYERLLKQGFRVIEADLAKHGQIFVDTKFEFGYAADTDGQEQLVYMDEVGTPDSSRIWDVADWQRGKIIERSKEGFRQFLLNHFADPDILLNKERMSERRKLAQDNALPVPAMMDLSNTYKDIAETITGKPLVVSSDPKQEIVDVLNEGYGLVV